MMHNDEKDRYRNNSIVANYTRQLSKKLKIQSNVRFTDTYLQYDLKRKKFLSQSNKHPADIKGKRILDSIKRKWTRKC